MFFYLSKIAWFFLQPSNLLILVAAAGTLLVLLRLSRRTARALLVAGVGGLALCGYSPLGNLMVLPLEERFAPWQEEGGPPDGIVLLGGAFVTSISEARGTVELNEAAERMTAFAALARRYPEARLVFTGGVGGLLGGRVTEAELAARLFEDLGLDPDRIELEERSRNTWENAAFTRAMIAPETGERWLLVTSAWHMPRAVGSFRAAGFGVEPYPVDFRTRGWRDALRPFDTASEGLRRTDLAVREWIGLLAYRITGRSSELLPGR